KGNTHGNEEKGEENFCNFFQVSLIPECHKCIYHILFLSIHICSFTRGWLLLAHVLQVQAGSIPRMGSEWCRFLRLPAAFRVWYHAAVARNLRREQVGSNHESVAGCFRDTW